MSEHDINSANEKEFDELLKADLSELPPESDVVHEITPWRKAINRVLIGMALSTVTLNFLCLNYILPAIGMILILLGFRFLRHENAGFRACWIISIIRSVYFLAALIVNATIWQASFYQLPILTAFNYVNIAVILILMFGLRSGFRSVQRKAGLPAHTSGVAALIGWYIVLGFLGFLQYLGLIIGIAIVVAYVFIIRSLYRLSSELDKAGYAIKAAPIKISDTILSVVIFIALAVGITAGYLFFDDYPMTWSKIEKTERYEQEDQKVRLQALGFPEAVLHDLTDEDLAACDGAIRVITDQKDHPVNNGRGVVTREGNTTSYSTAYDVKELRITSVAVELPGEREQWKIFHHFEWVVEPDVYGTEVIQLWPTYRDNFGWSKDGTFSGHVLYDDDGQTYAAPYYSLEDATYQKEDFFFGNRITTDAFAAFSFPSGKTHYRGYVSYQILETMDGSIIDAWINYVHQRGWLQYPVQTALDFTVTRSMLSSDSAFYMVQDALQFYPNDQDPQPFR